MAQPFQLVVDCTDPALMSQFWAEALGYVVEPPPAGFDNWDDYWRDVGVPEDELGGGPDRISTPPVTGPASGSRSCPNTRP